MTCSWPEVDTCVDVPVVVISVPFVELDWPVVDLGNDVPVVDFAVVVTEGGGEEAVVIKMVLRLKKCFLKKNHNL